jgi:hypothetical protein
LNHCSGYGRRDDVGTFDNSLRQFKRRIQEHGEVTLRLQAQTSEDKYIVSGPVQTQSAAWEEFGASAREQKTR